MTSDDYRRELAASRISVRGDYAALRRELDFATKAKRAVASRPLPWLGGAAVLGFLLSGRKRAKTAPRKKGATEAIAAPAKKAGFLGLALAVARIVFPLIQPALTAFLTRQLGGYLSARGRSPFH